MHNYPTYFSYILGIKFKSFNLRVFPVDIEASKCLKKKLSLFFTEYLTNNFKTTVKCETKPTSKFKNLNVFEGVIWLFSVCSVRYTVYLQYKLMSTVHNVQYTVYKSSVQWTNTLHSDPDPWFVIKNYKYLFVLV